MTPGFRQANKGGRSKEITKKWPCKSKTLRRRNSWHSMVSGFIFYISLIRKTHFRCVLGKCFHLSHLSLLPNVTQNTLVLHAPRISTG